MAEILEERAVGGEKTGESFVERANEVSPHHPGNDGELISFGQLYKSLATEYDTMRQRCVRPRHRSSYSNNCTQILGIPPEGSFETDRGVALTDV